MHLAGSDIYKINHLIQIAAISLLSSIIHGSEIILDYVFNFILYAFFICKKNISVIESEFSIQGFGFLDKAGGIWSLLFLVITSFLRTILIYRSNIDFYYVMKSSILSSSIIMLMHLILKKYEK